MHFSKVNMKIVTKKKDLGYYL